MNKEKTKDKDKDNNLIKMSWQTYVDDHLMADIEGQQGHHLAAAAILGHDGSVWAQSSTFPKVRDIFTTNFLDKYHWI